MNTDSVVPARLEKPATSFRDPAGQVTLLGDRVLRVVSDPEAAKSFALLSQTKSYARWIAEKKLVETRVLGPEEAKVAPNSDRAALVLEHERVPFPSYPYEWPAEMLHAAGKLTLELATESLASGFGLKDATPYNILFRGPRPVFIDLLSFEARDANDPTWLPYAQFVRTFSMPLLVSKHFAMSTERSLSRRDGLEPEEVFPLTRPFRRWAPPFLGLVTLPTLLGKKRGASNPSLYEKKREANREKAEFIVRSVLGTLGRSLDKLAPKTGVKSTWSDYMADGHNNYSEAHFARKSEFVDRALKATGAKKVLDVGCNTGHFSALAARAGAEVVAVDLDPVVVGNVWRQAFEEKLDILPLVVNVAHPTPATGWKNRECRSFLERARGYADTVMMLAVVHHLLVSERIPLDELMSLAAELTTDSLIIEFVSPEDSMFKALTRGRDALYRHLTVDYFEAVAAREFEIVERQHVEGTERWLYRMRKKSGFATSRSASRSPI